MNYYAGIGSRETPAEVLETMCQIGTELAARDWCLRSGRAKGADQWFELGASLHTDGTNGKWEIFLPWNGFCHAAHDGFRYLALEGLDPTAVLMAERIAASVHPAWERCSQGARKLHTRNVFQVLGTSLNTPVEMVICWTPDGEASGGTGLAIRVANKAQIPVFNLQKEGALEALVNFVDSKG